VTEKHRLEDEVAEKAKKIALLESHVCDLSHVPVMAK
jgi:hypothetical protein